jgi:hypothetical protein
LEKAGVSMFNQFPSFPKMRYQLTLKMERFELELLELRLASKQDSELTITYGTANLIINVPTIDPIYLELENMD